jgi:hypothetical protein
MINVFLCSFVFFLYIFVMFFKIPSFFYKIFFGKSFIVFFCVLFYLFDTSVKKGIYVYMIRNSKIQLTDAKTIYIFSLYSCLTLNSVDYEMRFDSLHRIISKKII